MVKKRPVSSEEEPTVYKTRIKTIAREKGFKVSGEFIIAFDKVVRELLERAIRRAEAEGRKTLLPRHL